MNEQAQAKRGWKAPEIVDVGSVMDVTDGADGNLRDNHPDVPVFYEPFKQSMRLDEEVRLDD